MGQYMMAFYNYIFIFLIILIIIFLVLSFRHKLIKKRFLRKLVNSFVIVALIFLTFSVALFPDFITVKETGEYSYDYYVMELTDTSRLEDFKNDGSYRKLSVLVYYPIGEITNNSCPLVVFSHGGISTKTSNISLFKELASHGYFVISIDHTYHSLLTVIDGKRIYIDSSYMKELNNENSHLDIQNSFNCFQKWMKLRTDDINFVIDTFIQKSLEENSDLYSLIDHENIGLAGHSLGGSAVLGVARQREDINAVIALESPYMNDIIGVDGNEFIWNSNPFSCAIMNIYSDSGYPLIESDNKYVQNKIYLNDYENVENYYIEGSNHFSITDLVRKSPILCAVLGGGYNKSGYQTLEYINQKSLAFFNKHLR